MSDDVVKKALWWLCLLVAPLVLIGIELFHPAGFTHEPGMYEYLSKPQPWAPEHKALEYFGPAWWFKLHMIQTPMVGLVAVGLWLLIGGIGSASGRLTVVAAWISRAATFVFVIYYTALDSIGGSGLARLIQITERCQSGAAQAVQDSPCMTPQGVAFSLTPQQVEGVVNVLNAAWTDTWVGGVGSFISQTGSWAVFVAALFAAVALFTARRAPWPALILLIGFGWELQMSHTAFHGPIAFTLLIASALWIRFGSKRRGPAGEGEQTAA